MFGNDLQYKPEVLYSSKGEERYTKAEIEKAISNNDIIEATVIKCTAEYDLVISLGNGITGIVPYKEIELKLDGTDIKRVAVTSKIGKSIKFIPIEEIKREDIAGDVILCSRKKAQEKCMNNYIKNLHRGDIVEARAVRVDSFGIFCDIGCGIIALLPSSFISITHINNPQITLKRLNKLYAVIKDIDDLSRIQLSLREILGTWKEQAEQFQVGDIVKATVVSIESYGVFVRISQNLSALANETEDKLEIGDVVLVKICVIKEDDMRIKAQIINILPTEKDKLFFKFTQTSGHISDWVYSVPGAKKQIESHFDN